MDFDYTTETITPDNTNILTIGGTGGLELSVGTTGDRPVSPVNGTIRYNSTLSTVEGYSNSSWVSLIGVTSFAGGSTGLTPASSTTGAVTLAGTLNAVNGGTGLATYAVGDVLYANTTTTLARRADVATGNALISGGIGVAPTYGKIGLTTHVSGILPIANGGTNLSTTPTNGQLLIGNGTGYTLASLTAGVGVTITPGAGTITISSPSSGGTVTSITATQPAAGLTITGSPITTSGTLTFALANDLAAVENLATNGIAVRTGTSTWATRTNTGTTNQITITNGDGVVGNPTFAIANNPILPGTGSLTLTSGTTAQRPVSPVNGMIRYNTDIGATEMYQSGSWFTVSGTTTGTHGIINIYTGSIPAATGTSAVPWDNTPPDSTEGSQIWTFTVTPVLLSSEFKLTVPFTADCGSSNRIVISSIFRNNINIGSALFFATGGGRPTTTTLSVSDSPATLLPVTYSMRTGVGSGSSTWYVNSTSAGNDLGGALVSSWQITEVA